MECARRKTYAVFLGDRHSGSRVIGGVDLDEFVSSSEIVVVVGCKIS
jgi:hypothetical protein